MRWTHPAHLIATWFGTGCLPKAPGTWGSLAALPFAWAIASYGGSVALLVAAGGALAAGIWASGVMERATGDKDPGKIVIDEVAGQWLTLVPVAPDPLLYLIGFLLFRIADIVKPWPASWCDRNLSGGVGVMLDDIAAGAYAAVALYLIAEFLL
ncbi:MAG: phosphatidylglycerophosphatase A [Rhodospirillaceae bacterium]|nr:phosphatidylglycerophosphatase A [Rhodospirillaceae bacterium]MDD9916114.1 phosphatidylglycerophosphatase A [Rhodospirillaceae bacterium]MDD9926263.1 phosphatidylglycerophosphatase A [Rhodospirillaceae bacterium]